MKVQRISKFIIVCSISLIIIVFFSFRACDRSRRLSFVPSALKVSKIIYAEEESSGFGPGGNESGVIVYELSEEVALEIKKDAAKFFSGASASVEGDNDRNGRFEKWEETPLLSDPSWRETPVDKLATATPQIENYLNRFGPGVSVAPNINEEINSIISKRGAYFAEGRTGIIIVAPEAKKVIYAYSG